MGRSIGKSSLWVRSILAHYRAERKRVDVPAASSRFGSGSSVLIRLALVVNRYKQLGSTCGLLFYSCFVNYLAQTIKNLRGSL